VTLWETRCQISVRVIERAIRIWKGYRGNRRTWRGYVSVRSTSKSTTVFLMGRSLSAGIIAAAAAILLSSQFEIKSGVSNRLVEDVKVLIGLLLYRGSVLRSKGAMIEFCSGRSIFWRGSLQGDVPHRSDCVGSPLASSVPASGSKWSRC
jgi:hypothetical protein